MPVEVGIQELPEELTADDAVDAVYGDDLRWAEDKLRQGLSVLIECDKQLVSYVYSQIRSRLREERDGRRIACRFVSCVPSNHGCCEWLIWIAGRSGIGFRGQERFDVGSVGGRVVPPLTTCA